MEGKTELVGYSAVARRAAELDPMNYQRLDTLGWVPFDATGQNADVSIEKVAYSAFYQSRLEWALRGLDVDRVLVAGIVTNGGVASTVRDAHVRGFAPVVISDGCAAFDGDVHDATVRSLASIVPTTTIAQACAELQQ